jgi:DNA polymerase-3 subunit epsilon
MRVMARFAAIDFETADTGRDSACAIGITVAENGAIVAQDYRLIRPPRRDILFTYIHGIRWEDVRDEPSFAELWPELRPLLEGVDFVAAHNASFDAAVLRACCAAADLEEEARAFLCTVKLARQVWQIFPTKLPNVCRELGIALRHHRADSDAEACARIVIAAEAAGAPVGPLLRH